jgi:ribosome-associated protein
VLAVDEIAELGGVALDSLERNSSEQSSPELDSANRNSLANQNSLANRNSTDQDSLELARDIVGVIADQKGEDVLLLDIQEVSILADYFIIGSVNSTRQAKAVIEELKQGTKHRFDVRPFRIEGDANSGWVLMDYGSVVVHLFTPEMRAYYDLEGLWRGGRVVVRML